ncbi:hypothetical protein F5144DRAFT_625494 [Chaetomium tenue]|uniref:Uncharacterized protein n=1 Tax=Chaetomium tenue TaxID=1854479 RepID=A0ACB7PRU1_9PEZI|nr:hypothetical protein F5144DRAFT_625494 [Chaetomium globosum]
MASSSSQSTQADEDPVAKFGVDFSPKFTFSLLTLQYLGGYRYHVKPDSSIVQDLKDTKAIYVGINRLSLAPVMAKKDPSPTGTRAALKLFSADDSRSVYDPVPTVNVLRQTTSDLFIGILTGNEGEQLSPDEVVVMAAEGEELSQRLIQGLPLGMPSHTGYASKKKTHPDNICDSIRGVQYSLPIFRIAEDDVPKRAMDLLGLWMVEHPQDLLYMQVAIQKVLQWIYIASSSTLRLEDDMDGDEAPVPFVSLTDWLRCAHLYEAFHQIHELVYYCHPFRFTEKVLRGEASPARVASDFVPPNPVEEELILVLTPLAVSPFGYALPCFFRGSTMPDFAVLVPKQGFLPRTEANLATTNQPDWRSLFWSHIPLWNDSPIKPSGTQKRPHTERDVSDLSREI